MEYLKSTKQKQPYLRSLRAKAREEEQRGGLGDRLRGLEVGGGQAEDDVSPLATTAAALQRMEGARAHDARSDDADDRVSGIRHPAAAQLPRRGQGERRPTSCARSRSAFQRSYHRVCRQ